jgi:nitrogen regulatory protein PII
MSYRDQLTRMTRIEVVITGDDVAAVRELLRSAGVPGFTMVSGVAGLGHGGFHQGSLLFNEHDSQSMLIAVTPDEEAEQLVAGLRELLKERSGVMFVSDTYVSRPEYFGASRSSGAADSAG